MRDLDERQIAFSYDYPMRCDSCGAVTTVSAEDYFDQINDCHVPCSGCDDDLHFGPAVGAIRDPADPTLDDVTVHRVAWYHTSTESDWPATHRAPKDMGWVADLLSPEGIARAQERYLDQALHVGTYEAAIESMLRRMRNQGDASSEFFLYRVALRTDTRVEPGYRDENAQAAAQITQTEIRAAGFEAIRYLNVWEAMGDLSLAVCRESIEAVQVVPIPIPDLTAAVPDGLVGTVDVALRQADSLKVDSALRRTAGRAQLPAAVGLPAEYWDAWADIRDDLTCALLPNVSPVICADVIHAMSSWENEQEPPRADLLIGRWAAIAALMELPGEVISRLGRAPARLV